jgi:predicted nucleic acid-binding protein
LSARAFVLDNSVVMAWALGEEDPGADRVMDLLADAEAQVPGVWPLELANALVVAERRGRLTGAEAVRAREIVLALPIRVVQETPERVVTAILALARDQGLSVYDACYLDLAMREGLPLATLDVRLRDAARRCSVPLVLDESVASGP